MSDLFEKISWITFIVKIGILGIVNLLNLKLMFLKLKNQTKNDEIMNHFYHLYTLYAYSQLLITVGNSEF
jgi:hypothetical protein